jgi:hypothetical protein
MLRLPLALAAWLQACAAATASSPAAACGPPPKAPWPAVADLPACGAFPDPWLRSDNTRVSTPAEWQEHRSDMVKLLEQYMYGHAPEQPPVRSTLTGSAEVERYCERVRQGCNGSPSERNVTDCAMRCLSLETPQTLRNYTLRVGPSADKTWPFDVFVYTPKGAKGPLPFVIYNGEGFYSGVEYGDLTAQGAKVLLDRGFGLALFNRNELRKVRFNKTHAFFFLSQRKRRYISRQAQDKREGMLIHKRLTFSLNTGPQDRRLRHRWLRNGRSRRRADALPRQRLVDHLCVGVGRCSRD